MNTSVRIFTKRTVLIVSALVLIVGSIVIDPKPAKAAAYQMRSGYYMGTGAANNTISGMGFQPDLVIIKSSTNAGMARYKTSAMPANMTFHMGNATAVDTSTAITLNATGFTTSALAEINTINVLYHWIAYGGSDCSATGNFCVGTYTGGNPTPRTVTVGFQPALVINKAGTTTNGTHFRTASMPVDTSQYFSSTTAPTAGTFIRSLTATGFTAGSAINENNVPHYYIVFGATGNFKEGTYTGTGTDNVSISGLGFKPASVFIKNTTSATTASRRALLSTSYHHGDLASYPGEAVANTVNGIQALETDGFQRGSLANSNENGGTFYWFAFGTEPSPSASGTHTFNQGTYTGTGSAFSITGVGFSPDLVIIRASGTASPGLVARIKLQNSDITYPMGLAIAPYTGAITSLDAGGFTLGTHASVNSLGEEYTWMAFGNAYNPNTQSGAADFAIGMYYGNNIDNRDIIGIPFQPDMVTVKTTASGVGFLRTAAVYTGDQTGSWGSTTPAANLIQSIGANGFQVGNGTNVNTSAVLIAWFAFKSGTNLTMGSYTGDGVNGSLKAIPSFRPDLVWVRRAQAGFSGAVMLKSSLWSGPVTRFSTGTGESTNHITQLNGGGITTSSNTEVNSSGGTYVYMAWRKPLPETLSTNIVDDTGAVIASPNIAMPPAIEQFDCSTVVGSLGDTTQRIRITNMRTSASWSTSIAPTGGSTAVWSNAGNTRFYDFNDTNDSGCTDGADGDAYAGSLQISPSTQTVAPESLCAATNLNSGSNQTFSEGSVNAVTLVSASAGADTACYWDIYGAQVIQKIPAEQRADSYEVNMTVTTVAT